MVTDSHLSVKYGSRGDTPGSCPTSDHRWSATQFRLLAPHRRDGRFVSPRVGCGDRPGLIAYGRANPMRAGATRDRVRIRSVRRPQRRSRGRVGGIRGGRARHRGGELRRYQPPGDQADSDQGHADEVPDRAAVQKDTGLQLDGLHLAGLHLAGLHLSVAGAPGCVVGARGHDDCAGALDERFEHRPSVTCRTHTPRHQVLSGRRSATHGRPASPRRDTVGRHEPADPPSGRSGPPGRSRRLVVSRATST